MARYTSADFPQYTVNGQTVILEDDINNQVNQSTFLEWRQYTKNIPLVTQGGRRFFATTYVDDFFENHDDANVVSETIWDNQFNEPCLYQEGTDAFIVTETEGSLILVEPAPHLD